ncbi:putative ribonuclease H-like domain-containing protein [Tanacetum coccineum]
MCDKKNSVLFTDTECLILSPSFKLLDENQVVLRAPRQNGVYSLDLKNIVPSGGSGPDWMFDLDFLTNTMNYIPVSVENQVNNVDGGTKNIMLQDSAKDVAEKEEQHNLREAEQALKDELERMIAQEIAAKTIDDATRQAFEEEKKRAAQATSINKLNTGRPSVSASNSPLVSTANTPDASATSTPTGANTEDDSNVFPNDGIFSGAYDDKDVGTVTDFNNMDNTIDVSPILTLRVHKDHPKGKILGDLKSAVQTRGKIQKASSVKAMQEELLQFKLQKVWILVDLPSGKKAIGTKWEEGIDYDEVFAPVAMIEAIRLFLAFASFMGFPVYQMDVKSAFLYGTIEEEVKQQPDGIFISQDKYVADILKKFDFCSIKTATTPIVSNKPLVKDEDGVDVDVHVYRSMIDSLMYLTASRPDIMFAVCACARFQVIPKASHLNAVKRIFRYLKHQPKLGLWYPRDSPFELDAFLDSDYGGASLDRKSTTAANCCGQVLWIQNQMMDYGFNFMNTKIHIDNESTIFIVKNPVYHSRTKHIEIRHHFIRDSYKKRLIDVIKIHTDADVANLLTKGFDVIRFNFLVVNIGMINL